VLVTGAAGLIGGIVIDALSAQYQLCGLDLRRGSHVDWIRDMTKLQRIQPAFDRMDAVVDLAADSSASASWSSVLRNNVPATVNAFEAARRAGVRRIVVASSNHVVGMYEDDEPYASVLAGRYDGLDPATLTRLTAAAPIRPDGPYGAGKAMVEAAARYYAEEYDLSVICLRIGTVNRENRPTNTRHFATFLSHRDLGSLLRCCLAAPDDLRFGVFYGVSANTWRIWDVEHAVAAIGYMPEDDAEAWR
jgi:nucleoside-diphosphate-sugar epimerase